MWHDMLGLAIARWEFFLKYWHIEFGILIGWAIFWIIVYKVTRDK